MVTRLVVLVMLCGAGLAQASGFYLGDNGARASLLGGAFTAQADDVTAMQYNPAGLTRMPGLSLLADTNLLWHTVTFARQDPGFDPANPTTLVPTVQNKVDSPFLLPFFGANYGFKLFGRGAAVGLGLFAPPSQGKYDFPAPNYATDDAGKYVESPLKYAPQRYALISNDIIIAYPTLSLAYEVFPWLQVGVSAQLTLANFKQVQTMFGGDSLGINPMRQLQEDPNYDATVAIDLAGRVGFTAVFGLMARPTEWLSFGASLRPAIPFVGRGKMTVDLPKFFQDAGARVVGANGESCASEAQTSVTNCTATLRMTLPLEVRAGARAMPVRGLGINFDFVYQGWNSIDQLLLTPESVSIVGAPGAAPASIAAFGVKKNWMPTWSVRLGASVRLIKYLSVSVGANYETGAAPTSTYSVDWTHPTRLIVTGGLTAHLPFVELVAGALVTPKVTTVVQDSVVARGQTNPDLTPGVVGNGLYTSEAWGLLFGLRGHFGERAAPTRAEQPLIELGGGEAAPAPAPGAAN